MVKPLDTNETFVGGAGMFIQYHDVIKPVYLYAVIKMLLNKDYHGLPLNILETLDIPSLLEWYINRRYINPLKQLDYQHIVDETQLDIFLHEYIENDPGIYTVAPVLNFSRILDVYRSQFMVFPIYIYSEKESKHIKHDCDSLLGSIDHKCLFGDLKDCIKQCNQNFTYIFSSINEFKVACNFLKGSYANILLAHDYRYNYLDGHETFKENMEKLMKDNFPIRTGTISVYDGLDLSNIFSNIIQGGI